MRVAIYYTPRAGDSLTGVAAQWLGRDAFTAATFPPIGGDGLAPDEVRDLTSDPRRYGFHATVKAPFTLAEGRTIEELDAALAAFCRTARAVDLGRLAIAELDRFVALVPASEPAAVRGLAQSVVETFDRFRSPPDERDLARRRAAGLDAAGEANLVRWGYPHVGEAYRFHMTLSNGIARDERQAVIKLLRRRLNGFLDEPYRLDGLALFVEPGPGENFVVQSRHDLQPSSAT